MGVSLELFEEQKKEVSDTLARTEERYQRTLAILTDRLNKLRQRVSHLERRRRKPRKRK